jgi:hypothetical protein
MLIAWILAVTGKGRGEGKVRSVDGGGPIYCCWCWPLLIVSRLIWRLRGRAKPFVGGSCNADFFVLFLKKRAISPLFAFCGGRFFNSKLAPDLGRAERWFLAAAIAGGLPKIK